MPTSSFLYLHHSVVMLHGLNEQYEYRHPGHVSQPSVLSFSEMPPYTCAKKEIRIEMSIEENVSISRVVKT